MWFDQDGNMDFDENDAKGATDRIKKFGNGAADLMVGLSSSYKKSRDKKQVEKMMAEDRQKQARKFNEKMSAEARDEFRDSVLNARKAEITASEVKEKKTAPKSGGERDLVDYLENTDGEDIKPGLKLVIKGKTNDGEDFVIGGDNPTPRHDYDLDRDVSDERLREMIRQDEKREKQRRRQRSR